MGRDDRGRIVAEGEPRNFAGMLGEDDEKPEVEGRESLATAEAFAAAVAARFTGNDPAVARKTENFLDKQARLLEIQADHLKDEHAVRLHLLHGQAAEVDLRRWGLRLRVGFQIFLALVAIVIAIGVAMLVRDAIESPSVVTEAFDVAPNVPSYVPSGKIPSGYYSWGMALAKPGDLVGAAAKFKDANQRGPHWADPLKAWGDVLLKLGHPQGGAREIHRGPQLRTEPGRFEGSDHGGKKDMEIS